MSEGEKDWTPEMGIPRYEVLCGHKIYVEDGPLVYVGDHVAFSCENPGECPLPVASAGHPEAWREGYRRHLEEMRRKDAEQRGVPS